MKSWPKVKLGQVQVGSNIAQNHSSSPWSLFAPIHMKSWPKVKLGKVQVGSNIAQNQSSSPYEVISGHYLPQFTWKVDQNWNYVKFKSVRTLLRITHLTHRKSYLVIICPNSHEKLTASVIRSNYYLVQFGFTYPYFTPKYYFGPYLALGHVNLIVCFTSWDFPNSIIQPGEKIHTEKKPGQHKVEFFMKWHM